MSDGHVHDWHLPEGGFMVIDTLPPQYPYRCECGAFTHWPESGEPCRVCDPVDFARRARGGVPLPEETA